MPKQLVNELREGDSVDSTFVVRRKQLVAFRNKPGRYLSLVLADRSGQVDARLWDNAEEIADQFAEEDVVAVQGRVETFNQKPQVIISGLQRCDPEAFDDQEFLPQCRRDPEALEEELLQIVDSVQQPYLRKLLGAFFEDPKFLAIFRRAPGAVSIHHAYLGGLMEHTMEVCSLCRLFCQHYPDLNCDLLLTGALLHDIGKLTELSFERSFGYTDEGRLLGHIAMGERIITEQMDRIEGFPAQLKLMMRHLILSHHGEYQYETVRKAMTLEAITLHKAEDADAQVNRFWQIITKHRDGERTWTDYDRLLERFIYLGPSEEDGAEETTLTLFDTQES